MPFHEDVMSHLATSPMNTNRMRIEQAKTYHHVLGPKSANRMPQMTANRMKTEMVHLNLVRRFTGSQPLSDRAGHHGTLRPLSEESRFREPPAPGQILLPLATQR